MSRGNPVEFTRRLVNGTLQRCGNRVQLEDANGVVESTPIVPTHTAVNVAAVSTAVLAANANRRYALLVNDSVTVIYLSLGVAAVVNQGIRLNANGGSYEISAALGNPYQGAINAIHGAVGNRLLLMTEGV